MIIRALAVGVVCVMASMSSALADTYSYVARVDDEAIFLDEGSIGKEGSTVSFWVVQVPQSSTAKYGHFMMRQTIDCPVRRIRATNMSVYDLNNALVASDSQGADEDDIEPGTVEQDLFKAVCEGDFQNHARLEAGSPYALAKRWREEVAAFRAGN